MTDDVADLEAEFPAWEFGQSWVTVNTGPDVRQIHGWNRDTGDHLTAFDADEMRRKIGKPGGER